MRIWRAQWEKGTEESMDALAKQLDAKLRKWQPEMADQVRQRIAEIIELADQDVLDVSRSRLVEQEVLDMIDAPTTR
jgi:DNA-directed RNA polymerase